MSSTHNETVVLEQQRTTREIAQIQYGREMALPTILFIVGVFNLILNVRKYLACDDLMDTVIKCNPINCNPIQSHINCNPTESH